MKKLILIALFLILVIGSLFAYQIQLTYANLEGTWVFDCIDSQGRPQSEFTTFYEMGPGGILFKFSATHRPSFEGYARIYGNSIYFYSNDNVHFDTMSNCEITQTTYDSGSRFNRLTYTNSGGVRGVIVTYK